MTQQWTKSPLSSKTHLTNSQRKAKSQSIDWLLFLWSTLIRLCYKIKKTQRMCLLVHAHHQLLRNATALRCLASLLVAMSTAFAHLKCRGAWVRFTCGRSGETCSKRSARNSEPCEFTHLGERHTRFREFSAVGTGRSPKERHLHLWSTHICLCYALQLCCGALHPNRWLWPKTKVRLKCKRLSGLLFWSEWRDLNSRPLGPEPSALPNCATPRQRS